jgi:hypothetical protein
MLIRAPDRATDFCDTQIAGWEEMAMARGESSCHVALHVPHSQKRDNSVRILLLRSMTGSLLHDASSLLLFDCRRNVVSAMEI